jgi:replication-associated recombination protein RarA
MTDDFNIDCSERKHLRPLLSESLRPRALSDLALPTPTIERLQRVLESGSMVNMSFYGPPGSGKTSAAEILWTPSEAGRSIAPLRGAPI